MVFVGNKVDEMQEELTNLLFGDGDNITFALQDSHGDLEDAEEFTSDDYELYDEDKVAARRMSEDDPSDLPLAVRHQYWPSLGPVIIPSSW